MLLVASIPAGEIEPAVVAGRAIHRLDQFWVTGNHTFVTPYQAMEARQDGTTGKLSA